MGQTDQVVAIPEATAPLTRPARIARYAAIAFFIALVARFFYLIHTWAIDVIFWDQFVFYLSAWDERGPWALFNRQHGPHRMGLGLNLMKLINDAFAWDQRVLAFFVGGVMLLAALAALWLKRRIAGPLQWHDIFIPLLILSGVQWELYASCVNLSHGALPLLLVMCIALALTLPGQLLKYLLIAALTFVATFTGFSFFCIVAVPAVLVVRAAAVVAEHRWRGGMVELAGISLCLIGCGLTAWSFFSDYVFEPAVPGFVFPHPRPWEYLEFMALSVSYLFGTRLAGINKLPGTGEMIYGCIVLAALVAAGIWSLRRIWRNRSGALGYVTLFLLLFSGAFLANMAIGRVCTGLQYAMTSRYTPLIMPAGVGLYLVVLQLRRPRLKIIAIGLLLATSGLASFRSPTRLMRHYVEGKTRWLEAYRRTGDYLQAERLSGFQIFPAPDAFGLDIPARVRWLQARELSFTRTRTTVPTSSPATE